MKHILEIDESTKLELNKLFEKISRGHAILFLGAGASVTNKKVLSKDLIEHYERRIGKKLETYDIIEFIDFLESSRDFERDDFDNFVATQLRSLKHSKEHEILASIPWNEIITTNIDVLVEQAFEAVKGTPDELLELKVIRSLKESYYTTDNSQLKYIKLNGCISDKSLYPLAFSSNDFDDLNKYYKDILTPLKGVSDRIVFISIGYSFSDPFATKLLRKLDSYNYRRRRVLYNIDPNVNTDRLSYYEDQNISVIKLDFKGFFKLYSEWEESINKSEVYTKRLAFKNSQGRNMVIPSKLLLKLNNSISQISTYLSQPFINEIDFYLGEEPNFDLIKRDVPVKREALINRSVEKISKLFNDKKLAFIPLVFAKGRFCSGKTTLSYQVIKKLINDPELDCVAFEVKDVSSISSNHLAELFKLSKASNIIIYFNSVEIDSHMTALTKLRYELSIDENNTYHVLFYASIRENILLRYKRTRAFENSYEIKTNTNFTDSELEDLLKKLKESRLIKYRDKGEMLSLKRSALQSFNGDSFLTLVSLLSQGNHHRILFDAYNQLSQSAKDALIYTSLSYRYKLMMPSGVLLNLISKDWDDFRTNVINAEGRGILIQEVNESRNATPDLYFKTKHPTISELLIDELLPNKEEQFKKYLRIINSLDYSISNTWFIIDLLKAIVRYQLFPQSKINELYLRGFNNFNEDPYYLLYFSINLQKKKTVEDLKGALNHLIYAESLLDYRNNRFTHRRASINFDLAKKYYDIEKNELSETFKYINEADELFKLKQEIDPFSSFSYVDYVRFLMWKLEKLVFDKDVELSIHVQLYDLFDYSSRAVKENQLKILSLKSEYLNKYTNQSNSEEYFKELTEYYENTETRPFALILLYDYYTEVVPDDEKIYDIIEEVKHYSYIEEVAKFLFKYYGRNLYSMENRMRFFELIKENNFLEETDNLRYNYFRYIAEAYNGNFSYAFEHLRTIKDNYSNINPDFSQVWCDDSGEELIFEGILDTNRKGIRIAKVPYFPRDFYISKNTAPYDYKRLKKVDVKLHFLLYGISAEVLSSTED